MKDDVKKSTSDKKLTYIIRACMTTLTVVMIILFFCMILLVNSIQGTARVVNYAGLVRGETQRIIKLENAGEPQDGMIADVTSFIDGLQNGSDELDLVRLNDKKFQSKMKELDADFEDLKQEIQLVREKGYENTDIIEKSENFFGVCDEATGLAAAYSQKRASSLNILERIVIADICGLIALIALELFKALRTAAQNRLLQKKVYLDEATGLPNKNKCEEVLDAPIARDESGEEIPTAVCVFDLNNLRTINNNLGHEKGDEYIRSFAVQMRKALPEQYFAGRDGGDEFIAVLTGVSHDDVQECLNAIKKQAAEYSEQNPEMPISYAAGYALSSDLDGCTMRDLFRYADKNMYVDKNRAKMEEAAERKRHDIALLHSIEERGYDFSSCMYCDALLDQYRMLRASSSFILAEDGSYSGAVEEIVNRFSVEETRKDMWNMMQLSSISRYLSAEEPEMDLLCKYFVENETADAGGVTAGASEDSIRDLRHGRITVLFCDAAEDGRLHHFIMGFEKFRNISSDSSDEKAQFARYYDQIRHQITESGDYMEALIQSAEAVYTVDLTNDIINNMFFHTDHPEFAVEAVTPASYDIYCMRQSRFVTEETLESYRIVDSSEKLLGRFANGEKQVTVEFQEEGREGRLIWLQKTVLMTRETVYDSDTGEERSIVRGMIMFKDTSEFHEKAEAEKKRLQTAFDEADSASRAKTDFLNRMSHDIRTPINGIMGMLDIIKKNREDHTKTDECLEKIHLSTKHLLALVNDVLDMSRLESGRSQIEEIPFDLNELMDEVASLLDAQITEVGLTHSKHRKNVIHTHLIGSPLHLKQIMLNLFSNSIKYNKPGGSIDTYAEEISCDGDTVLYEFKISDKGIGMSEEFIQNKIFKPFTQENAGARTEYQGTGLGLSIVSALIEKMNGSIHVDSVKGEGTTFIFRLPFMLDNEYENTGAAPGAAADAETGDAKSAEALSMPEGMRILLVEDNDLNMEIGEFYLTERGALVTEAWNGSEAVDVFAASEPYEFDMILMDVMMPVMDGLEATRRIRKLERPDAKDIVIIAMTAQVTTESARECLEAGMNDHMAKPIDPERLAEMIAEHSKDRIRKSEQKEK